MLWFSGTTLFLLTLVAWQTARHMKADGESARLRTTYLAAAICGAIGTLCFFLAALI